MTTVQIFAFVVLPALVALGGYALAHFHKRWAATVAIEPSPTDAFGSVSAVLRAGTMVVEPTVRSFTGQYHDQGLAYAEDKTKIDLIKKP